MRVRLGPRLRSLTLPRAWRAASVAAVVLAALFAALAALSAYRDDRQLRVAGIELSVQPGHQGALDLYVPLVDWGVRFDAVRFPARLSIDVLGVDRDAATAIAAGAPPELEALREEAGDAIASYIRELVVVVLVAGLGGGALVALAVRGGSVPRMRWLLGAAGVTAALVAASVALFLPPRGELRDPEYYANGPDIPIALETIERATASARAISGELDEQLTGLARLVSASAEHEPLEPFPRVTLASDLHNNLLALPALEEAVATGPLLFAGDLTANGTPFEARLIRRVVEIGRPFVFVPGNHDSDVLSRRLADAGAIVLTERGRLNPDGTFGDPVVEVGGLRVAGYSDPFERQRRHGFQARGEPEPSGPQRAAFRRWLASMRGRVDVVLVHSPALAAPAVDKLRASPPPAPMAILTGHTHVPRLETSRNLVELNSGTVGGGGFGNFEEDQPFALSILVYRSEPAFRPLAVDQVEIDLPDGSSKAERHRLDLRGDQQ